MNSLRDQAIALARSANEALAAEQWSIAAQGYRAALRLDPTIPGIYINLAAALQGLGNRAAARRACEQAITLDPSRPEGPRNWLRLLDWADRPAAIAACQALFDRQPACAPLYLAVGQGLDNRDDFPALMDWVRSRPLPETWRSLPPRDRAAIGYWHGLKHYFDRELEQSERWLRQAIADDPDYPPPHVQLSIVLSGQRRFADALTALDLACDRWPEDGTLRHNRALCLLALGRWAEGFEENEWQWRSGQMTKKDLPGQEWDGTPIPGRTVLIWADQGFGDSLQWARYLAWVAERCDQVIFMCQKALVSVMRSAPGVAYATDGAGETLNFNTHLPLSSLPRLAKTTVDRVPAPIPYLFVAGDRAIAPDHPALALTSGKRLRVGIVWASGFRAGARLEEVHRQKSADLAEFTAALNLPEVQLYSLQVDRSEADAARLAELGIIDLAPQIRDFADTAAWLDQLDLLITVDTAICHLAGAMGKPVWTLLYFAADWRWLLDREDTPWYPTMRLFRQTSAGDWSEPLARVRSTLSELARSPGSLSTDPAIEPLQNYFVLGQHWIAEQGLDSWLAWLHQNPPRTLGGLSPAEQAVIAFWQGMSCDRPDYQDWAAAQDHLRRAIALDPSLGNAAARLAYILANQGQFTEALAVTEQALGYLPEDGGLRMNRALCLLVLGRWRDAWPDYEWRGRSGQGALTDVAGPQWDGRPLPGQTLLVLVEQGYGDTLQFGRYLAWAKQRCDRVVMWCGQPPLRRLLPLLPGLDQVYEGDNVAIQYHAHVHLLSLPGLADTTVDNVPTPIPYLRSLAPAPPLPDRQPDRLAVGIVWSSGYRSASLLAAVHRQKSADLTELAIALNLPEVQLYSLQVDRSEADAARLAELGIIDLAPQIHDFADTAAWLDQLDLLITVDTAICHLAGAMGKPVWTLLYFAADWRWLLDREDTPWYPTMRLFRQTTAGDWSEPLARVRSALSELARSPQALHQRSR